MNRALYLGMICVILLTACKNKPVQEEETFISENSIKESAEVKEIIYSMYLPTDMAELFDKAGSNFNPELPAPVNTLPLYTDTEQMAVLLGILGVDLSYMKILDQKTMAAEYYSSIKILSGKLEIPDAIFKKSSKILEQNINNQDSLASVIESVYADTDQFFRKNGDDNLASLSLLGGWVEAMYIGVSIYEGEEGNRTMAHTTEIYTQQYIFHPEQSPGIPACNQLSSYAKKASQRV